MSGEHLTAGFFGKIPAAGDFVARGLSSSFVRFWDPFAAAHLVAVLERKPGSDHPGALRFMVGPAAHGPMAGVVLTSRDRVGRSFPLTLAAALDRAVMEIGVHALPWFEAVEELGRLACHGEFGVEELASRLASVGVPSAPAFGTPMEQMVMWTDPYELFEIDLEDPRPGLLRALSREHEVG